MNDYVMLKLAQDHQAELAREAAHHRLARRSRTLAADPTMAVTHRSVPMLALVAAGVLAASGILLLALTCVPTVFF